MRANHGKCFLAGTMALAFVAAGCLDGTKIQIELTPSTVMVGEGPVRLKAVVSDEEAFDFRWRVLSRPKNSVAEVVDPTALEATFEPDVAGKYEFSFSATTGGRHTGGGVASRVGGRKISSRRAPLVATALQVDESQSSLEATPARAFANGQDVVEILVVARDSAGQPVAGLPVTVDVSGEGNALSPESVPTNAEGQAAFELVSTRAGVKTVTASVGNATLSAEVEFVNSGADLSKSTITVDPATGARVSEDSGVSVVVELVDEAGSALPGVEIEFSTTESSDVFKPAAAAVTDENGRAAIELLATRSGARQVVATFVGDTLQTTVEFAPGDVDIDQSSIEITDSVLTAGEPATITATLRDRFGNPVPRRTVHASGCEYVEYDRFQTKTDDEGRAQIVITSYWVFDDDCRVVLQWEYETLPGEEGGWGTLGVDISSRAGPISASASRLTAVPSVVAPGGMVELMLVVQDDFGNRYGALPVEWASAGAAGQFDTTDAETSDYGEAYGAWTGQAYGLATVTATFGDPSMTLSADILVSDRNVNSDMTNLVVTPIEGLQANGEDTVEAKLCVFDDQGVEFEGVPVSFVAESEGYSGYRVERMSPPSATTGVDGCAHATFSTTIAGYWNIGAEFGHGNRLSEGVEFDAGPVSREKSSLVFDREEGFLPEAQLYATLLLRDAFGNPKQDVEVELSVDNEEVEAWTWEESRTDWSGELGIIVGSNKAGKVTLTVAGFSDGEGSERFSFSATAWFLEEPPEITLLSAPDNFQMCAETRFEVRQANRQPVELRFEFRDASGAWRPATPLWDSSDEGREHIGGNTEIEPDTAPDDLWPTAWFGVRHYFPWNVAADEKHFGESAVQFRIRPFLDGVEGRGMTTSISRLPRPEATELVLPENVSGRTGKMVEVRAGSSGERGELYWLMREPNGIAWCSNDREYLSCADAIPVEQPAKAIGLVSIPVWDNEGQEAGVLLSEQGAVGIAYGTETHMEQFWSKPGAGRTAFVAHPAGNTEDTLELIVVGESGGQGIVELLRTSVSEFIGEAQTIAIVPQPLIDVALVPRGFSGVQDLLALGRAGDIYVLVKDRQGEFKLTETFSVGATDATQLVMVDSEVMSVAFMDAKAKQVVLVPTVRSESDDESDADLEFDVNAARRFTFEAAPVQLFDLWQRNLGTDLFVALENGDVYWIRPESDERVAPGRVGNVGGSSVGLYVERESNELRVISAFDEREVSVLEIDHVAMCFPEVSTPVN